MDFSYHVLFYFFCSGAPASQFENDVPLARRTCQVVSCAVVGGAKKSDSR